MENANKEEHGRCLELAEAARARGELERALRLVAKAERLKPGDSRTASMKGRIERQGERKEQASRKENGAASRGGGVTSERASA